MIHKYIPNLISGFFANDAVLIKASIIWKELQSGCAEYDRKWVVNETEYEFAE